MTTYIPRRNDGDGFTASLVMQEPVLTQKTRPTPTLTITSHQSRTKQQSLHRKRTNGCSISLPTSKGGKYAQKARTLSNKIKDLIEATNAALLDDATEEDFANWATGSTGRNYESK